MRTQDLELSRKQELAAQDNTRDLRRARQGLGQYCQVKKVLVHYGFIHRGRPVISTEIVTHVLEELRKERKIKMAIQRTDHIEEYIDIKLPPILEEVDLETLDEATRTEVEDKLEFRKQFAEMVVITNLSYMHIMIKKVYGKGTIPDPDAFRDIIRQVLQRKFKSKRSA